jgi:phosphohistidine phosphatase
MTTPTRGPGGRFVAASRPDTSEPDPGGLGLFLLRHADAGDPAAWAGDDAERPLSKKGRKQARVLGAHLDDLRLGIDAIITSPRVRAADTAKAVGKALGVKPTRDDRLSGGFDPPGLRELLGGLDASVSNVVLVGHDPDFSTIASWLTDAPNALRKGAIVRIDLPSRGAVAGSGALRWLLPPDALRG